MNIQNKKAFTLVELIVVITILAILGTIAFVSLQGYSKTVRDVRRIADIQNIKKSLELFHLNTGEYPLPDNFGEVSYSGELVWTQGFVGDNVTRNLSRNLQKKPTDPLTEIEYTYSLTNTLDEYQLLAIYESDYKKDLINQVSAAKKLYPRIEGIYNELYVMTPSYIIPTPSIITSESLSGGLILDDTNIKSQIISYGANIPSVGAKQAITGGLDINLSVYTGSITGTSTDENKENFVLAIQGAYTGSVLAAQDAYKVILDIPENELIYYVNTSILYVIGGDTRAPNGGSFIFTDGADEITETSVTDVTLDIVCANDLEGSEPIEMYISGDIEGISVWEDCVTNKIVTLIDGDGNKNISIKWRDNKLNETEMLTKSIDLSTLKYFVDNGRTYYLINKGYNETSVHAEWQYDTCVSAGKITIWGGCGDTNTIKQIAATAIYNQGLNNGNSFGVVLMDVSANSSWRGIQYGTHDTCTNNPQGMCMSGYSNTGNYQSRCTNSSGGDYGTRTGVPTTRRTGGTWSLCTD